MSPPNRSHGALSLQQGCQKWRSGLHWTHLISGRSPAFVLLTKINLKKFRARQNFFTGIFREKKGHDPTADELNWYLTVRFAAPSYLERTYRLETNE